MDVRPLQLPPPVAPEPATTLADIPIQTGASR